MALSNSSLALQRLDLDLIDQIVASVAHRFPPLATALATTAGGSPGANRLTPLVNGGAPSGFRTPDPLIKSWSIPSRPVGYGPVAVSAR
jgi:hypothetical protein